MKSKFDTRRVHRERASEDADADLNDRRCGLEEAETVEAARHDVVERPLGTLIAEIMRHVTPPFKGRGYISLGFAEALLRSYLRVSK